MVDRRIADCLLRGHVRWCSDRDPDACQGRAIHRPVQRLGDAEVHDHGVALVEQNVLGFDVPVDDVLMVGGRQRVGDLAENHQCIANPNRALAR